MPSVLVTGANRGIGLEFARQYAADGWRVLATCRDPGRAAELEALAGDVAVYALDVADFAAVDRLARDLEGEAVDVLISNAGVYGPDQQSLETLDYEGWLEAFRIDCMAPVHVSRAFLPHVARSGRKVIVAMTTKMGSVDDNTSGGSYVYRTSKAALNMAFKSLAIDLAPRGIVAAVIHPGWVMTDLGGPRALITAEASVSAMRRLIAGLGTEEAGRFWAYDGKEIAW